MKEYQTNLPLEETEKSVPDFSEVSRCLGEIFSHSSNLQQQIANSVEDIKRNMPKDNDAVLREILQTVSNTANQNELAREMHNEIQKLRGNFYSDLLMPIILEIIEISDDAKRISSVSENLPNIVERLEYLEKEIKSHIEFSTEKLFNRGIKSYQSEGEEFDGMRHKIVEMIETSEQEKHDMVAESIKPGYIWIFNDSRNEIVRREEVKVYKYKE